MGKKHSGKHGKSGKIKEKNKPHDKDKLRGEMVEGKISITAAGYGFVTPLEGGGDDFFIPPKHIGIALHGDIVEIERVKEEKRFRRGGDDDGKRGSIGRVVRVLGAARSRVVGEIIADHKIRPINRRIPDIDIVGGFLGGKRGDWVEANLIGDERDTRGGEVTTVIGEAGIIENDLDAIIREYGLPDPYGEDDNLAAAAAKPLAVERRDLTAWPTVTIDPPDAKDYDDAVSLAPGENEGELLLGVHIADVAAWAPRGSRWDKAAAERCFTAYLPGRTLPMLPKSMTAAISLGPNRRSPAHSVLISVDAQSGKVLRSTRCHSEIAVDARLDFDTVDEFIAGKTPAAWPDNVAGLLRQLLELSRRMRGYRAVAEQFLHLATTEVRILCDEERKEVIGLRREEQTESDQLVEECMLAANVEVAKELVNRAIPGLFRIHAEPDPEKVEEFSAFMAESFGMVPGDLTSRAACNNFLDKLPDDHRRPIIINSFLRCLPRAEYSAECALHFGLGKGRYSHFTSPIRRYCDLIVHQQLWAADQNGELQGKKAVAEIAAYCSERELKNDEAYRAANDRLKLRYLNKTMANEEIACYEAVVSRITKEGMNVEIPDLGMLGIVPRENIERDFRVQKGKVVARRGHEAYRCGDFVYVALDRVDNIRGVALFRPIRY